MATKKKSGIDRHYQTDNEHWNRYVFDMLTDALGNGLFDDPERPLILYNKAVDTLEAGHQTPFQAVQTLENDLRAHGLSPEQTLFIFGWVCKFVNNTEFENIDLSQTRKLLEKRRDALKKELQPEAPLTFDIRERLKALMEKELAELPKTLETLEPAQRLNIVCKLIPYVLPKVEAVSCTTGEPLQFGF